MMENANRKYQFSWDLVGIVGGEARPSLGNTTTLEIYRLMQFTLRDILEQRLGTEATDDVFRSAGVLAGRAFFERYCAEAKTLGDLARILQERFRDLSIGLVRFEKIDLESMAIQLTVDEDLDCSGMPDTNDQVCVFDEGLIKGILEAFTGKSFSVREVDCWCSGERTCRFRAIMDA